MEKVAESDIGRKLELSGMRKSAESDVKESQKLYKTQNSDTKEERDKKGGELSCDDIRSMESRAEGKDGLVDPVQKTLHTQAGTSGHSRHDVTDPTVK